MEFGMSFETIFTHNNATITNNPITCASPHGDLTWHTDFLEPCFQHYLNSV